MARYFFDLYECGVVSKDDEGSVMANLGEVRDEALRAAREVMCAEVKEGRLCLSCRIDVRDETGAAALSVPFKEALEITGL